MAKVEKYKKKNGETAYKFRIFLGLDHNGKQKYAKKSGFKTKQEALEKLAQLEGKKEKGEIYTKVLFKDLYSEWLEGYESTVRAITYNRTLDLFRLKILPVFGLKYVDDIDQEFCQQTLNKWAKEYSKYKALKGYTQQILELAVTKDLIKSNPMLKCAMPKVSKAKLKLLNTRDNTEETENYYNAKELKEFLNLLEQDYDYMWFTAFRLLAYTGMRKGELMALKWSDIHTDRIVINKSMTMIRRVSYISDTKNEHSNRIISIDSATYSILMAWKKKQKDRYANVRDNHLLFTRDIPLKKLKDQPFDPDYLNRCLKTVFKNHSKIKKITVHGFRHTHASLLFESGATLKEVQERLGHQNGDITLKIYTHVTTTAKKETANKLAKYLDNQK